MSNYLELCKNEPRLPKECKVDVMFVRTLESRRILFCTFYIVFKGLVHRTEEKAETGLNRTD
jgi:hypothetical protein